MIPALLSAIIAPLFALARPLAHLAAEAADPHLWLSSGRIRFCAICFAFLESRKSCRLVKKERGAKTPEKEGCLSVRRPSALPPAACPSVSPPLRRVPLGPKSPKAEQCHEQSRRSIIRETFSFFSLERGKIARRVTTTTKEGNLLLWLAFSSCYSQAAARGKSLASGTFTPPSPIYKADCSK